MIVTSNIEVAGHEVVEEKGFVRGVTVRTRGVGFDILASIRMIFGGEVTAYTDMCEKARSEALERMVADARARNANAVVMARYDGNAGNGYTEFVCYGTAVRIEPLEGEEATSTRGTEHQMEQDFGGVGI